MRHQFHAAAVILYSAAALFAQSSVPILPMPAPEVQYFDSTGAMVAGGKLCTYQAGTSTPLATYIDATGNTQNPNPVILDVAGRASLWGAQGQAYKLTLREGGDGTCNTGTVLWTQDNIMLSGPGSFNGVVTTQTAAGATGTGSYIDLKPVTYPGGTCLDVYGNPVNQPVAVVGQSFGANDAVLWVSESPLAGASPPGCATAFNPNLTYGLNTNVYIFALGGFATNQPYYNSFQSLAGGMWALSFTALNYIQAGQYTGTLTTGPTITQNDHPHPGAISWSTVGGCLAAYDGTAWGCIGGTGGWPPSSAIAWVGNSTSGYLNITASSSASAGLYVAVGQVSSDAGFSACVAGIAGCATGTATQYNAIQAVAGGMAANSFTASNYVQVGNYTGTLTGGPTLSTNDHFHPGAISWSTAGGCLAYYTGSTWACFTGGSGANTSLSNLAAVSINSALLFQTAVDIGSAANPARNLYLAGSGTYGTNYWELTGTPSAARTLTLPDLTGTAAVVTGTWTNGYCLQAGSSPGQVVVTSGPCTTGGGGGTVSSATAGQIAFYTGSGTSSTVAGGSNLTWDNTNYILNIVAKNASSFGLYVQTGWIEADGGFETNSSATNAIQVPNGGISALHLVAGVYGGGGGDLTFQTLSSPAVAGSGQARLVFNGTQLMVSYNTGAFTALGGSGTAGVSSLNSLTGALTLVQTANQVLINPSGSNITFTLPQSIGTSSAVNFASVTAAGVFQSTVAYGSGLGLQVANSDGTPFSVNGYGDISGAGSINMQGASPAGAPYKVNGTTIVDGSRNGFFANITISGTCTGCSSSGVSSLTGTANEVYVNGTTGSAQSGAITLTLPQAINTGASPTFAALWIGSTQAINTSAQFTGTAVNVTGSVQAQVSSSAIAFQVYDTSNGTTPFEVNGAGTTSVAGSLNANGGIWTPSGTNSQIYIGSGAFYDYYASGNSTGASCSGIANGWMGTFGDGYVVICIAGARFRAQFTNF